jgi:hypothetical protein
MLHRIDMNGLHSRNGDHAQHKNRFHLLRPETRQRDVFDITPKRKTQVWNAVVLHAFVQLSE